MPSQWRQRIHDRLVIAGDNASDADYNSEDGEELDQVDENQHRDLGPSRPDLTRRLSREYAEHFP